MDGLHKVYKSRLSNSFEDENLKNRTEYMRDYMHGYLKDKDRKERHQKYVRESIQKLRKEILELLGNRCKLCGFSDFRALQIDHVNAGGRKHRRQYPSRCTYYRKILAEIKAGSKEYQCLCANCNEIKRVKNEEYGIRGMVNDSNV